MRDGSDPHKQYRLALEYDVGLYLYSDGGKGDHRVKRGEGKLQGRTASCFSRVRMSDEA